MQAVATLDSMLAAQTLWSSRTVQDLRDVTREWRPDVIHVHNTLLLVSPSVFWAADELGIPVVQTLHNFRAACLGGIFVRNGQVCEDCMGKTPWRGVVRRCYRGSVAQSAVLATMLIAGNAYNLLDRAYPVAKPAHMDALNQWAHKAIITPVPYPDWGIKEKTIGEQIILLPADLSALEYLMPVAVTIIAYTFFGLDALGDELEDPFGLEENDLPLSALARVIEIDLLDGLGVRPLPEAPQPVDFVLR